MGPKTSKNPESVVGEIKLKNRRKFNSEAKIRIILEGLKGEESSDKIRMGRITCFGKTSVRTALVEPCWWLTSEDPAML